MELPDVEERAVGIPAQAEVGSVRTQLLNTLVPDSKKPRRSGAIEDGSGET